MTPEAAAEVCRVAGRGDVLEVANENAPKQIVLSGSDAALDRAEELARARGAKAIRLKVAGAFHSPLMRPALDRVRDAISRMEFREPRLAVVPNASGRPTRQPAALRDLLSRHTVSPVRWERSIRALAESGVRGFVESGPGDVLSKLVRRIVPGVAVWAAGSPEAAQAAAEAINDNEPADLERVIP
jgi:[acyl-carrier-protein] S-malonyltransferase